MYGVRDVDEEAGEKAAVAAAGPGGRRRSSRRLSLDPLAHEHRDHRLSGDRRRSSLGLLVVSGVSAPQSARRVSSLGLLVMGGAPAAASLHETPRKESIDAQLRAAAGRALPPSRAPSGSPTGATAV